ncbi:hypothetical protein [Staphylococcus aureus]|uniref:hypothetical protein n=1 Tax=Staphylococcus aureus TaxID=1280 RepID=UPI0016433100
MVVFVLMLKRQYSQGELCELDALCLLEDDEIEYSFDVLEVWVIVGLRFWGDDLGDYGV